MATKPTQPKNAAKGRAKPAGTSGAKARAKAPAQAKAPALAKAPAKAPALALVGAETEPAVAKAAPGPGLRLKQLVDRVVAATGGKKKGVKDIVEATLAQMGTALQQGEALNLPAFGKLRVVRSGAESGGAMTLKLRQVTAGGASAGRGGGKSKGGNEALAQAEDED